MASRNILLLVSLVDTTVVYSLVGLAEIIGSSSLAVIMPLTYGISSLCVSLGLLVRASLGIFIR